MARPPRNELAVKSLADAVGVLQTQHKRQTGRPATSKDIELFGFGSLDMRVSEESIRKALTGQVDPTTCSIELLLVLASYFEVTTDELGGFASERVRRILAVAADPAYPTGGPISAEPGSPCTRSPQVDDLATVLEFRRAS